MIDLSPDDMTPEDRLRGAVALIRQQLAEMKARSGLIGKIEYQLLVAVPTPQGMGVLLALPGDEFLADIDAVTRIETGFAVRTETAEAWSTAGEGNVGESVVGWTIGGDE